MYIQPDLSSTRLSTTSTSRHWYIFSTFISNTFIFFSSSSTQPARPGRLNHEKKRESSWLLARNLARNPLSIGKDCPNCGHLVMVCCKLAILYIEEVEMKSRMCSKKGNDIKMPLSTALSSSINLEEAPLRISDPVCICFFIKLWWATTPATRVLGQSPLVGWFVKIILILLRTDTE